MYAIVTYRPGRDLIDHTIEQSLPFQLEGLAEGARRALQYDHAAVRDSTAGNGDGRLQGRRFQA